MSVVVPLAVMFVAVALARLENGLLGTPGSAPTRRAVPPAPPAPAATESTRVARSELVRAARRTAGRTFSPAGVAQ